MARDRLKIFILQGDPRDDKGEVLAVKRNREDLRPHILKYLKSRNIGEYESDSEFGGWTSVQKFNKWAEGKSIDELLNIQQFCCIPFITEWEV